MRNIALLMFLVCSTASIAAAAGKPSPRPAVVSLKVTVNANQQNGTATAVSPDALGLSYIDGQNNVWAILDTSGNLIINLSAAKGKNGSSTSRQFGLDLSKYIATPTTGESSCSWATPTISISNPPTYTNWITTWPVTDATHPTAPAFQNMAVGQTYYVGLEIRTGFSDPSQTTYFLSYHQTDCNCFPTDAALASYAQVRRTSLSPGQWVVEPVAPSGLTGGNPPNVAMLFEVTTTNTPHQSTIVKTECGFYQVPFSFTLDEQ